MGLADATLDLLEIFVNVAWRRLVSTDLLTALLGLVFVIQVLEELNVNVSLLLFGWNA